MGLLDQVIGSVVGQVLGRGRGGGQPQHGGVQGGGLGGSIGGILASPIGKAILMLLLSKAASGGLGNLGSIFGGGGGHTPQPHPHDPDSEGGPAPYGRGPSPDDGDLGGFGQGGGYAGGGHPGGHDPGGYGGGRSGGGGFSDLEGMLDGPGDRGGRSPGSGPYAQLDQEPGGHGPIGGGLDGLVQSFERGGLGDVIGSWIGHGSNQPIAPNRLADAIGSDTVDQLSRETGLSHDDLLQQLAQALPEVVNQLTPHGRPPSGEEQRNWL